MASAFGALCGFEALAFAACFFGDGFFFAAFLCRRALAALALNFAPIAAESRPPQRAKLIVGTVPKILHEKMALPWGSASSLYGRRNCWQAAQ